MALLARLPGYQGVDIARRLNMSKPAADKAIQTLRKQGRLERRTVTDPHHPNAGGLGYFPTEHHENTRLHH